MRHESIFVVYDSCQATAEEIADMLDQGKGVAMLVFNGENTKDNWIVENICKDLRRSGAHMIGEVFYADSDPWSRDCWIAGISPNL